MHYLNAVHVGCSLFSCPTRLDEVNIATKVAEDLETLVKDESNPVGRFMVNCYHKICDYVDYITCNPHNIPDPLETISKAERSKLISLAQPYGMMTFVRFDQAVAITDNVSGE